MTEASVEQSVQQSMRAAILTRLGERLLYPEFGSRLHEFFFRILDSSLLSELQAHLKSVLERCERRVKIQALEVSSNVQPNQIQIQIRYEILGSRRVGELFLAVEP